MTVRQLSHGCQPRKRTASLLPKRAADKDASDDDGSGDDGRKRARVDEQ